MVMQFFKSNASVEEYLSFMILVVYLNFSIQLAQLNSLLPNRLLERASDLTYYVRDSLQPFLSFILFVYTKNYFVDAITWNGMCPLSSRMCLRNKSSNWQQQAKYCCYGPKTLFAILFRSSAVDADSVEPMVFVEVRFSIASNIHSYSICAFQVSKRPYVLYLGLNIYLQLDGRNYVMQSI